MLLSGANWLGCRELSPSLLVGGGDCYHGALKCVWKMQNEGDIQLLFCHSSNFWGCELCAMLAFLQVVLDWNFLWYFIFLYILH